MIRNIVKKIIGSKEQAINELTNLKQQKPEYPTSHKQDPHAYAGKRGQADLLYLPEDKGYKYLLVVVDNYDGRTDALPLKKRDAETIRKGLFKIYDERKILKPPKILQVDAGSEFKKNLDKFLAEKGITLRVAGVARHSQQALVEARNKTFAKTILQVQLQKEIANNRVNREWLYMLPIILDEINKNAKPPKKKKITNEILCEEDYDCEVLPIGTKVRVQLDYPMDYSGKRYTGNFRVGDLRYDRKVRKIENILFVPDRPIRYVVEGISSNTYSKNQLKVAQNHVEDEYEVEEILEEKDGKYLVKWKNYPLDEATYEDKDKMMEDVPELVKKFVAKENKKIKEGEEYEIEKIVKETPTHYIIKWVGYKETTKEPKQMIREDAPELVREFEASKKKKKKTPVLRRSKRLAKKK